MGIIKLGIFSKFFCTQISNMVKTLSLSLSLSKGTSATRDHINLLGRPKFNQYVQYFFLGGEVGQLHLKILVFYFRKLILDHII
jgi:hypothetical protein